MLTTLFLSAAIAGQPAEPPQDYAADARAALSDHLARIPVAGRAKNVIVFVGDGLSISTATAARILDGQLRGVDGESNALSFEKFPYTGLSKTYSHDFQVSDSAATATAIMTGSKTRSGMINVTLDAQPSDCGPDARNRLQSLAEIAETAGKATGLVSTARITHATPATLYAHVPERDWESDDDVPEGLRESCPDIARQLIEWPAGDGLELAMGGGRAGFLPEDMADPEHEGEFGNRLDGRDLTAEWVEQAGENGAYVWNREQFDALDAANAPRVLALFEPSHMQYDADRADDPAGEPSLSDMTAKAIDILSADEDGFFLMVEGGRIDHAHHGGNAYRALTDAVAFSKAVETALSKVDPAETLIVVTADHGHTLTISGYPARGNPILGLAATPAAPLKAQDGKPYTTLGYANGPGAVDGERPDLSDVDVRDKDFRQQALVPSGSETHTGDDVPIYAKGPWAHLLTGVVEQNYIFHAMRHAMTYEENTAE